MLTASLLKRRDGFTLQARFQAPTPAVVALFGRSGCGKSTLVNLLSGLLEPDEGFIELDGTVLTDTSARVCVPVERRRIGYVFQDARLFPHFTVLGNLRYGHKRAPGVRNSGSASAGTMADRQAATSVRDCRSAVADTSGRAIGLEQVISLLGIESILARRPHQISGGERQRVALGRALLSQPHLLLLDEPLAALDAARREEVLPYLEVLRDRLAIPMVYVSHQFEEILRLATHVVLMEAGQVVAQGSLSEVSLLPQLRAIVGPDAVGAVLDGRVAGADTAGGMADIQLSDLPPGRGVLRVSLPNARIGAALRVQLLARDIILATGPPHGLSVRNALEGTIASLTDDGNEDAVLVTVDIGGAMVLARVTREAVSALKLARGGAVWALVKAVSTRGHAFQLGGARTTSTVMPQQQTSC